MKKLMSMLAASALVATPAMAAWDGELTNADVDAVLTFLASPLVDGEVFEGDDVEGDGAFDDIAELTDVLGDAGVAALVSALVNADEGIPEIAEWRLAAAVVSSQDPGDAEYDAWAATFAAVEADLSTTVFAGQEPALKLVTLLCVKNPISGALYIDAQGVGTGLADHLPAPLGDGTIVEAEDLSASGDLDGDGVTNLDEWINAATSIGLDISKAATFSATNSTFQLVVNQFVAAAQDPDQDGSVPGIDLPPGSPVGGALGLGLLSLAVAAAGAFAVRRK